MAAFNYVLDRPKSDGSHKIYIRISCGQERKRIDTPVVVYPSDMDRNGNIKNTQLLQAVLTFKNKCEEIYRNAGLSIIGLTAEQIKNLIISGVRQEYSGGGIDFIEFIKECSETKKCQNTKNGYLYLAKKLVGYSGLENLNTSKITYSFLKDFEKSINGQRSKSLYMTLFKACFHEAQKKYNDEDTGEILIKNNPFTKYVIPSNPAPPKPEPLTESEIIAIYNYTPKLQRDKIAKDVFLFSLFLCGTNTADIYNLHNLNNERIEYERQKTSSRRHDRALISILKNDFVEALIRKYKIRNRDILLFKDRYSSFKDFNKSVNKGLKIIGAEIGVPTLYFYQARDTFASWCRNKLGFPLDDVDLCLNHSHNAVIDRYVETDFTIIDRVQEKFIAYCHSLLST